jgi:hypothetical protein
MRDATTAGPSEARFVLDPPQPAPGGGTGATGPVEEQRHHLAFEQVEQGVGLQAVPLGLVLDVVGRR